VTYGSVCSGIEAATVAWRPLGWRAAWFAEIDPFCCALLSYRYPQIKNYGDFTKIGPDAGPIDLLVGGTPCQAFSVAGLRGGLDDPRGNLAIEFCRLAGRLRPRWVVWENVPGVLSSNGGRDFGTILGALAELGYGCAWRVLDAQFFGVPQRRRRVFVVGHLGDWRRAAAVLFERQGLCRDTPVRRKAREEVAGSLGGGTGERGWCNDFDRSGAFVPVSLNAKGGCGRLDGESETFVAHTLRSDSFGAGEDDTGRGTPLVAGTLKANHGGGGFGSDPSETFIPILEPGSRTGVSTTDPRAGIGVGKPGDPMYTLQAGRTHAIAFETRFARNGRGAPEEVVPPLKAQSGRTGKGDSAPCVAFGWDKSASQGVRIDETTDALQASPTSNPAVHVSMAVRHLTPRECERLQGFPDDYTLIDVRKHKQGCAIYNEPDEPCDCGAPYKPAADGPRYKAIGNSMAVPVMRWIGERIQAVEDLCH